MRTVLRFSVLLLGVTLLAACAHEKPYLYPNHAAQSRSQAQIERDINDCEALAKRSGLSYSKGGQVAKRTAEGGVVGGATGAAVGAVLGSAGRGAAAGAAGGATQGLFRGLFASDKPHPVYRAFVNRCLRNKGYQPIGWQ